MAIPSQTIRSCSTPTRWRVPFSAFLVFIMLLPSGCGLHSTVKGIPETEAASVRKGNKAVVLFRLAPLLDNTPVTTIGKIQSLEFPFNILRANIDQRESPSLSPSFSPSAEAAAENWVYYLIPPGTYWAGFVGPPNPMRWVNPNSRRNHFFLEVPEGVALLYAGTLSYTCWSRWTIGGGMAGLCGKLSILDESEDAGTVARRDLGEFGPMETILLRPMTWKTVDGGPMNLAPMGVALNGSLPFSPPGWKWRAIGRATGLDSETVMSLFSEPRPQGTPLSSIEKRMYLGYALYLPLGTLAGLVGGEHSAQEWSPCMNTIAGEVAHLSPQDAFRAALVDALARRGVDDVVPVDNLSSIYNESDQPRVRTVFEVEIQEVVLRECGERWAFCSEMKIRGQLRDVAKDRILYDGTLIHSNHSRRVSFPKQASTRPYEWLVNAHAVCRPIEKYCVPDGAKLFVEDLQEAIRILAGRLVVEAGISAGRGEAPGSFNMPGYD